MAAESEDSDVTEITEKNDEIANGVDIQKENYVLLIQIKRRKRSAQTNLTKLRHEFTSFLALKLPFTTKHLPL